MSGINAVLCLNGRTLDRHLSAAGKEGSVLIVSGSLTVRGSGTITGGHTAGYGGGLWVTSGGTLTLAGGTVGGNRAEIAGGGVYVSGSGSFVMTGGSVSGNTAENGGGVGIDSLGSFGLSAGTVSGNTAGVNGGGLWFGAGTTAEVTVSGGSVTGNSAGGQGGGLYINDSGAPALKDGVIAGNAAAAGGDVASKGGLYAPAFGVFIGEGITGGTAAADRSSAKEGETVAITVTPGADDGDYRLNSLAVTAGDTVIPTEQTGKNGFTFVMPAADVTVTAAFDRLYNITACVDLYNDRYGTEHGCAIVPERDMAAAGDTVTLTLHMGPGYRLMRSGFGGGIEINGDYGLASQVDGDTYVFTMPDEDAEVWAYIYTAEYTLTLSSLLSGVDFVVGDEYVPEQAPLMVKYNEAVQVRYLRPDENELRAMAYTYTENGHAVTVDIPFEFNDWDGFYTGSFPMPDSDVSVCVTYAALHDVEESVSTAQHGVAAASQTRAAAGDEIRLWAESYELYEATEWHVTAADGTSIAVTPVAGEENCCSFTMPDADVIFYADFARAFYGVFADPLIGHGSVEIHGSTAVRPGGTVSFTVTPDEHFECAEWNILADGSPLEPDSVDGNTVTFTMPEKDVTLTASFAPDENWSSLAAAIRSVR